MECEAKNCKKPATTTIVSPNIRVLLGLDPAIRYLCEAHKSLYKIAPNENW